MFCFYLRIPLNQCRIDYGAMDMEFRQIFPIQLKRLAPEFEIAEIRFGTFFRQFGYAGRHAASDVVYVIESILGTEKSALERMHSALEILDNVHKLNQGAKQAIRILPFFYDECYKTLLHKQIRIGRSVRYVVLRKTHTPFVMHRMAAFLLSATRHCRHGSLPLLVIANLPDAFRLAGAVPSDPDDNYSYFGLRGAFEAALQTSGYLNLHRFYLLDDILEITCRDIRPFLQAIQDLDWQ